MREYFPKSSEISKDVYKQVKAILEGYDRLKQERLNIMYGSGKDMAGLPRRNVPSDPTRDKAIRLSYINERLDGIGQACISMRAWLGDKVSGEFSPVKAFWGYGYFSSQHKGGPCRRTWNNFKYRFAALIAYNLNIF